MKRKCVECGNDIIFEDYSMDNLIRFEKKYYHYDCFINACKKKSNKANACQKWRQALDSIDKIQQETKDYFKVNHESTKDQLYRFILNNYNITAIPPYIFVKLEEIYTGKRKGLSRKIPPEDILDMWKQKKDYLVKVRERNIMLGKQLTEPQQITYDLSILLSKYDAYLNWKQKNQIIEQSINNAEEDCLLTVDLNKLSKISQKQTKEDEDDIDSLLDELFD